VRHSTTAAYYGLRSIIIVVHVIRLHWTSYVSSPETLTTHSHTKGKNFLPEMGSAYLESLRKEQPFGYPSNSKVEVRWSLAFFPGCYWMFEFALHFSLNTSIRLLFNDTNTNSSIGI